MIISATFFLASGFFNYGFLLIPKFTFERLGGSEGVERNYNEALKWYKKAADQGSETAKGNIKKLNDLGYY